MALFLFTKEKKGTKKNSLQNKWELGRKRLRFLRLRISKERKRRSLQVVSDQRRGRRPFRCSASQAALRNSQARSLTRRKKRGEEKGNGSFVRGRDGGSDRSVLSS